MMDKPMDVMEALRIAQSVKQGRSKYGAQFNAADPPYKIQEALVVLLQNGNYDGPTKEDMTKVNRQLAAAEARAAKCAKKTGDAS